MTIGSARHNGVFGPAQQQRPDPENSDKGAGQSVGTCGRARAVSLSIVLLIVSGCATPQKPPVPYGRSQPINSAATISLLTREAQAADGVVTNTSSDLSKSLFNRHSTRQGETAFQEGELIERTVVVEFPFGSTQFTPSSDLASRMDTLIQGAERVEIRGRSDGYGDQEGDRRTAHFRAEAAKRYLLHRGVSSEAISVNFQAAGDYVADNRDDIGRHRNRRVEIEFYLRESAVSEQNVNQALDGRAQTTTEFDQWQAVTKGMLLDVSDEWQPVGDAQ